MPRIKPLVKKEKKIHPNLRCWLEDRYPLDLPDEALELFMDDFRPGHDRRELWTKHRPGEPYIEPALWLMRRKDTT
jgi:hypothetical protein